MGAPWTEKPLKTGTLKADDEFMLLDSEVSDPLLKNKRTRLETIQANLVVDINASQKKITNLSEIEIYDTNNTNSFIISSDANLAADRILNLPLITADDTFALLNVSNIFTQDQNITTENSDTRILMTNYNDASPNGSTITGRRTRGTESSPTPILLGDNMLTFSAVGYFDTGFGLGSLITTEATENWTNSAHGSRITFGVTKQGATAITPSMEISGQENARVVFLQGAQIDTSVGFYGTTPIAKPTVTGSKAGNAALTSLLTQLATLGLITDSTT